MNTTATRFTLLLVFTFGCTLAKAQNISADTVTWNSTRAVGEVNNDQIVYNCQFITRAAQSIDWIQKNGARVNHYTVTGVEGSWPDVTFDGQVVYQVTLATYSGEITFSKSSGQTTVHLNISASGLPGMNYMFYIASVKGGQ